jgi:hypothetical protein
VCTTFNDQYIALVNPPPEGSINGNVSFDSQNNPVSVNLAFFDVCNSCEPWAANCFGSCPPVPTPCCPSGGTELIGTGFDGSWFNEGGGTDWLVTTSPIAAGATFTVRFAIWDTGDSALDSTVLIDNFRWSGQPGDVGTVEVPE